MARRNNNKRNIIVVILLLLGAGFAYWWFKVRTKFVAPVLGDINTISMENTGAGPIVYGGVKGVIDNTQYVPPALLSMDSNDPPLLQLSDYNNNPYFQNNPFAGRPNMSAFQV